MCDTFEINNFSVISSINDRNIYIKFSDNINFTTYETTADQKELRVNFSLPAIYKLMQKCFQKEENYTVEITATESMLKLTFDAFVGGFLKITFEVQLREKLMSNDVQLTTNFNKMEQKCNHLSRRIDDLTEIIERYQEENCMMINALSSAEICLGYTNNQSYSGCISKTLYVPMNIVELVINVAPNNTTLHWEKLSLLYALKKIKFSDIELQFSKFQINSLEEIEIISSQSQYDLFGIEKNENLKNVTLNGLINLTHPCFMPHIKKLKHLKNLTIITCRQINTVEIQTYCQVNGIALNIS